jgi:hypothetical protein
VTFIAVSLAFSLLSVVPTGQGPASPVPPPGSAAGPAGDEGQAPGRGGGRGQGGGGAYEGGSGLSGGPDLDDPAYATVDFSPADPVLPRTPEEERQRFQLQSGYRVDLVLA